MRVSVRECVHIVFFFSSFMREIIDECAGKTDHKKGKNGDTKAGNEELLSYNQ